MNELSSTLSTAAAAAKVWDILVIGAGPAGALTAREASRNGLRSLLVDKASFPRFKVCGGCLNASALDTLGRVGLADALRRLGAQPIHEIELTAFNQRARLPLPTGLSVSRAAFDEMLIRSAIEAGADFLSDVRAHVGVCRPETRAIALHHEAAQVTAAARCVILANGLSGISTVAEPKVRPIIAQGSRIGVGCEIVACRSTYKSGRIYMACGRQGYVGIVRVDDNRLNMAAALEPKFVTQSGGVGQAACRLLERAGYNPPAGMCELPWQATPLLTRRMRAVAAPRLLVVGDAAGYVEPFTGEGISWALAGGAAISSALCGLNSGWSTEMETRWTRIHRKLVLHRQRCCRGVAWWLRRPRLCRFSLRLLNRNPVLAHPLITYLNRPQKDA